MDTRERSSEQGPLTKLTMAAASASASSEEGVVPTHDLLVPNPTTTRGMPTRLHKSPDGQFIVYGAGSVVVVRSVEVRGDRFWGGAVPVSVRATVIARRIQPRRLCSRATQPK
jgi:hypothetical protein